MPPMSTTLRALVAAAVVVGLPSGVGVGATTTSAPDLPAFPGAIGFGAVTPGGRGGQVLVVDSLADEGPGTLRWALEEIVGPRIVVFAVGGVVELSREIAVGGRVTVAGQTAPGQGIVVRGARLHVVGDDVVIRGLKLRPGGGPGQDLQARDAISVGAEGRTVRRVVIDGNSLARAPDENAATWHAVSDVSFTNNIIAEGLEVPAIDSSSMGLLVGDGARRVTIARNLFSGNAHRNPQVKRAGEVEVINNLVHDYGPNGTAVAPGVEGPVSLHVIGNHYVEGPSTVDREPIRLMSSGPDHRYHVHDNLRTDRLGGTSSDGLIAGPAAGPSVDDAPVFEPSGVEALPAGAVARVVPLVAGARAQGLDAVDAAIVGAALGGGTRGAGRPPADAPADADVPSVEVTWEDGDADGIPDGVETLLGTDPERPDADEDLDGDGYTNVEEYINGVVDGGIGGAASCPAEAVRPDAEALTIEAEGMELIEGFEANGNPHASGGTMIQTDGAEISRARHALTAPAGRYDVAVRYFDEDDGVSVLSVRLDGRLVALWEWDEDRGTSIVEEASRAAHVIPCLELAPGMVLELVGFADGSEPLRVDAIALTPPGSSAGSN